MNSRFIKAGDKVKIINCSAAKKYGDKVFTVKQGPLLYDRTLAATLKEIRGHYYLKNLQIVE